MAERIITITATDEQGKILDSSEIVVPNELQIISVAQGTLGGNETGTELHIDEN
jgi:hypothetical protein